MGNVTVFVGLDYHQISLEAGNNSNTADVAYATGVTQTNSHQLNGGNSTWYSSSTLYRIRGVYKTSNGTGAFTLTPVTWQTVNAP